MTQETYEKMMENLKSNPRRVQFIRQMNQVLTGIVFCAYPLFLLMLFVEKDVFFVRAMIVPAVSFVCVTVFRRILNVPRPYERFGTEPVLEKDTKGKSFPSRHVFSVFMIAMTVFVRHPDVGMILAIIGVLLAVIRVAGGVHDIRDVVAGAVVGVCCGLVGYYAIPLAQLL